MGIMKKKAADLTVGESLLFGGLIGLLGLIPMAVVWVKEEFF